MTSKPLAPLKLPNESEILLAQMLTTDGKVDRLIPLLELLNTPEEERSDLGKALLEALILVSEEVQLSRNLRERQEVTIKDLTRLLAEIKEEQNQQRATMEAVLRTNMRLLKLLQSPV